MLTVIIPVFNGENTIKRCVESIIAQTYKNFEIILIDDGSTDQSPLICDLLCEMYQKQGFRFQVIHKKNGGVSSARNIGIDNASGAYFVCVDCDDRVTDSYLEDLIKGIESNDNNGHVCCGFVSRAQNKKYVFSEREEYSLMDRRDYMKLYNKVLVQSPCFRLYNTDIVKKYNIRMRDNISLGEDLLFNLEYFDAVKNTSFFIVNRANYIYYDESETSLNHKYRADLKEIYELINNSIEFYLKKWNAWDEETKTLFYAHVFNDYINILENTFNPQNTDSFWKKIQYNNQILKSDNFISAYQHKTIRYSFLLEAAYRTKQYQLVLLTKKIIRIVHTYIGR